MNALVESEEETPKVAPKPRRPGSVLRDERRTQGLSIEEVAEELRLPKRYVAALETGEYSKLPGETFARGYLRNYAVFLDIDPAPLLEMYARSVQPEKQPVVDSESRKRKATGRVKASDRDGFPVWVIAGVAGALILGAWLSGAFQSGETPMTPVASEQASETPEVRPDIPVTNAPAATAPVQASVATADRVAGSIASGIAAPAGSTGDPVAAGDRPVAAAESDSDPVEAAAPVLTELLVIAFSEDCWIRIRDGAGNTLSSGVKKAGEVLTLESGAPYSLLIGNVGGVLVSYNGEPVDLAPYDDKNVAKFTLK